MKLQQDAASAPVATAARARSAHRATVAGRAIERSQRMACTIRSVVQLTNCSDGSESGGAREGLTAQT